MGILDGLNLPTLADTTKGGWRKDTPEPTRLEKKTADIRDERKEEAAWRKAIWRRDGGCCRWCHREVRKCLDLVPTRGECHHISGRVVKEIRWDVRNGLLLCATCHERLTGKVAEKHVLQSKHTFTVDGVQYVNGDKPMKFTRVA